MLGSSTFSHSKVRDTMQPSGNKVASYGLTTSPIGAGGWINGPTDYDRPLPVCGTQERIAYERGKDVWFKNCVHCKETIVRSLLTRRKAWFSHTTNANDYDYYAIAPGVYGALYMAGTEGDLQPYTSEEFESLDISAFNLSGSQLTDVLTEGLRHMIPEISNLTDEFSLLNFMYELKDIPDMFKVWSRQKSLLKNFSSGVLNYELGWKPFLADCKRMFDAFTTLNDKIKKWNDDAGRGVIYTRHANVTSFYEDLAGVESSSETSRVTLGTWGGDYWNNLGYSASHTLWADKLQRTEYKCIVHMYFRPKYIPNHFLEQRILVWYDALGFGQGASVIWNAVPFSFVLDWFYGLGDFLEQFKTTALDVGYDLVDFGYSLKKEELLSYDPNVGRDVNHNDLYGNLGSHSRKRTIYIRRRCHAPMEKLDDINWSPLWDFHCPSWKQVWVGANLITAIFGK